MLSVHALAFNDAEILHEIGMKWDEREGEEEEEEDEEEEDEEEEEERERKWSYLAISREKEERESVFAVVVGAVIAALVKVAVTWILFWWK